MRALHVAIGTFAGLVLGIWLPMVGCNELTGAADIEIGSTGGGVAAAAPSGGAGGRGGTEPSGGSGGTIEPPDASPDTQLDAADSNPPDTGPDALDPDGDEDLDGVRNAIDNCPEVFNPCQYDKDRDDVGDACDATCEEICIGRTCNFPGQQGCNCDHNSCPAGYRCIYDSDFETGRRGDVPLPDGGTYHCDPQFHWLCAESCSPTESCTYGTCVDLVAYCICFSQCPFCTMCE